MAIRFNMRPLLEAATITAAASEAAGYDASWHASADNHNKASVFPRSENDTR